jgi:hypothetical protein
MLYFNPKHYYSLKLFDQNYFVWNGMMMTLNQLVLLWKIYNQSKKEKVNT